MPLPDIFITQDPVINASALGFFGKPSVLINSAAVEAFTEGELLSVLGHELSHIKCGHTRWLQVTNSAENKVRIPIVSDMMGFAFLIWSRRAEYTCDRGGLIACRDVTAAISALAKVAVGGQLFAKLNLPALLDQKGEVDADAMARWAESFSSHPFIVNRLYAVTKFNKSILYTYVVGSPA